MDRVFVVAVLSGLIILSLIILMTGETRTQILMALVAFAISGIGYMIGRSH